MSFQSPFCSNTENVLDKRKFGCQRRSKERASSIINSWCHLQHFNSTHLTPYQNKTGIVSCRNSCHTNDWANPCSITVYKCNTDVTPIRMFDPRWKPIKILQGFNQRETAWQSFAGRQGDGIDGLVIQQKSGENHKELTCLPIFWLQEFPIWSNHSSLGEVVPILNLEQLIRAVLEKKPHYSLPKTKQKPLGLDIEATLRCKKKNYSSSIGCNYMDVHTSWFLKAQVTQTFATHQRTRDHPAIPWSNKNS